MNEPAVTKSTNVRSSGSVPPRASRGSIALRATRAGFRFLGPRAPDVAARWAEHIFLSPRRFARAYWEHELLVSGAESAISYDGGWLPTWSWAGTEARGGKRGHGLGERTLDAPTVLLVHGWEGRGSQLGGFVEPLVECGFRVVAFDAPGHGDSPLRAGSMVDHARAVVAIGRALGPVDAVIGHSIGGAAALLATRFGFEARRFVLLAPPVSPSRFANLFADVLGIAEPVRERMKARIAARYRIPFDAIDARPDAERLSAPLLVLHDPADAVVPIEEGRTLAALAPEGRLVETEGLGHAAILRAPGVIRTVRDFVQGGQAGADRTRSPSFAETLDGELFLRDRRWTRRP
jgi:pimeloyl-ACP methyl ester carboxylesterase